MKRIIAFVLSVAMLFTLLPSLTMSTRAAERVEIYYNGNAQDSVILPKGDYIELNAVKNVVGEATYQWQVYIADNVWVDISGETGTNIRVSYAMIANILSGNEARIRCEMVCEGETINSDPVIVTVSEENSNAAAVIPEDDDVQILQPIPIPSTSEEESEEKSVGSEVSSGDNISSGDVPVVVEDIPVVKTFSLRSASVNAVANEPAEKVNIVINYVFTNGEVAAQPYTATVAKGSDFSAVVNNPDVIGYLPHEGENAESTSSVTLNYTDIQEEQTITVTYKPTMVNYTIVYKLQNVDGNGYTEDMDSKEIKQGLTDSIVPAVDKNFEGFSMLWYDTPAIAADGSTVVEVYYDRNFYLMLFELDGGYGVEPIYARYGAPISISNPSRLGYVFQSWIPSVPSEMPLNGGTYTAQWSAANTTYTIVYWAENANDDNYSFWDTETISALSGTIVSGSDDFNGTTEMPKDGFHFDHADQNVTVEGDGSTIVNVYYKRNTYTLIFSYENGPLICDTHVHSTDCYEIVCGYKEHEHTYTSSYKTGGLISGTRYYCGGCYPEGDANAKTGGATSGNEICGMEEHEHTTGNFYTNSCYGDEYICGLTGTNNHSHSVSNGCYGIKFENIKYGQATDEYWEQAPAMKWLVNYGGTTFYTNAPAMPNSDLTIYGTSQSGTSTIHYYEKVNGQETTNSIRPDYVVNTSNWSFTEEDYIYIPGFSYSSSRKSGNQYYIYYTRESYNLTFKNGSEVIDKGKKLYETNISGEYFVPTYNGDEPEAYTFGGWYTTESCIEGTEFSFINAKMPYNNLILYAKWIPVNHSVKVYLTDADAENGNNKIGDTLIVPHGSKVAEDRIPADPTNGDLKFVGWFYMDGDVEKAFDFNNMPVNKDLTIYAKWSDTTIVSYYVYYRAKDSEGNEILDKNDMPLELADPTTGQALTGISRTFEAKASEELLKGYQEGYFPETKSHTMVLEAGKDNKYIFYYVPVEAVPYKVYYKIVDENGNVIDYAIKNADGTEYIKEVNDNRKAVVTENFVVVPGYMPDAYQKRLVVSADGKGNEITFYYVKDDKHAYYQLTHYTENIDGGWTEYSSSQAIGEVGTTYNAQPLTINGFTYDVDKTEIVVGDKTTIGTSHSLTTEGLEIRHYYIRNSYPYEVHYLEHLEQGTEKELAAAKTTDANGNTLTGKYGDVVSEEAIVIPGYECITPSPSTLTIRIEIDDVKNIIYFYYKEAEVDINYKVVGPDGVTDFGTVDLNDGTTTGAMAETSETVLAKSGVAVGATATASNKAYKFVGWYADEACTQRVSTNASYIPTKPSDGIWEEVTYYAKFEYNLTSMTISKTVTGISYDDSDIFIFDVKGSDGSEFSLYLKAGETKTITDVTVGVTYTVTERTNWSTRYTNTSSPGAKTLVADTTQNVFAFTNEIKESKWLSVTKMETNVFDKKN